MAERTLIVCDVCGKPAVEIVNMKVGARTLTKDVRAEHLKVMTQGARAPRPGRRAGVLASGAASSVGAKRRGRPPGSKNKASRKRAGKRSAAKRTAGTRGKAKRTSRARSRSAAA